jgi:hypothetical protein
MSELADKIAEFSAEFDTKCYERHVAGEDKYGAGTWLTIDTLQHAMDEVLDLANYARFTYIKLRMLQEKLVEFQADQSIAKAKPGYDGPLAKLHTGGMPG